MMNNDLKITVVTKNTTFFTAVQNASKFEINQETGHEKSKIREYRQKIVIIDYESVPVTQETLKEWSDNSQFLILVLEQAHDEVIQEFQDYISDVWYKPLNSVILEKRLSIFRKLYSVESIGYIRFELKTPLSTIQGYSELLLLGGKSIPSLTPLNEEQHRFVSIIKDNTLRMNYFVNNLSTYFQIIHEKINLKFERLNITALLSEIRDRKLYHVPDSSEPLCDFELYQEDGLPEIYADEYRLIQIIEMLLRSGNTNGSTQIKLNISQIDTYINFAINSEKEFIRSHENEYYFWGIPFGETIIPHIIEAHKGTMQIESSHETGSTFSFTIPIADNQEVDSE